MNSTTPRSTIMQYRDQEFRYDSDMLCELEIKFVRGLSDGNHYRQKRSGSPKRRRAARVSHAGHGISGRRNHRWTW